MEDTDTQSGKADTHVKTEAETGERLPHTKDTTQEPRGVTRGWKRQGRVVPSSLWREWGSANTLIPDFWPPEL